LLEEGEDGPFLGLEAGEGFRDLLLGALLQDVDHRPFEVGIDDSGVASYLLKLKNIKLKFFVLSLPPSGQSEIIIFGNPSGTPDDKTVGWYAAYAKE